MNRTSRQIPRGKYALTLPAGAAVLIAIVLIWFSRLPYATARQMMDHLAKDGSLDSFTTQMHSLAQVVSLAAALLLLSAGLFVLIAPARVQGFLGAFGRGLRSLIVDWPRDAAAALRELPRRLLRNDVLIPAFVLTLFAFLARVLYINDPMRHDEAYSFVVFAKLPLNLAIADYHFPNNHLLNTLLMHISQRLFGNDPWVVRLPAFSAGLALVPAGYLLTRQLYGGLAAWLASAAMAASPVLIHYSTNARGYSLLALFTLLTFILVIDQTRRSNLFYWTLAALFAALGFFALPVFLIPFGLILTWLILCGMNTKVIAPAARAGWYAHLLFFTATTLLITVLFYLPVARYSGIAAIIANPYVESISWQDFWPTLISRLQDLSVEWTGNIPQFFIPLTFLGIGLSLVLHGQISRLRVATQVAFIIAVPVTLLALRPNPWPRIWLSLYPLLLIWAAGGLVAGLQFLQKRLRVKAALASAVTTLAIAGLAALAAVNAVQSHPRLRSEAGPVEQTAIYLQGQLTQDDIVVIAPIDDAPLWYYFYKYNLSQDYFRRDVPFRKAYVLVSTNEDQTLQHVLDYRGPDPGFLLMSTTRREAAWGPLELYSIEADWQAVSKAYQLGQP